MKKICDRVSIRSLAVRRGVSHVWIEIRKVLEASDWDEGGVDPALIEQEHKLREEVGG